MNKNFMQVDKQNDETSEFLNNLFASEGQRLIRQLDDANFNAGVQDAKRGLAPAKQWCKPYMTGYKAYQAVKTAVTEMFGVTR